MKDPAPRGRLLIPITSPALISQPRGETATDSQLLLFARLLQDRHSLEL